MSTQYGKFHDFCRESTLPVCNLFPQSIDNDPRFHEFNGGCVLEGISLSGGRHLRNLGTIILCGIAIVVTILLFWRTQRKRAAVGRREMQLVLIGYLGMEICEIFTVGGIPLSSDILIGFTAPHLAFITATTWMLMLSGAVGYQAIDDGNFLSVSLILGSAAALFIGTGYIALDTGYSWTGFWDSTLKYPNQSYSLYTLYLLVPLVFLFIYFVLEAILVIKVLGEIRPMIYLSIAVILFAIGQVFNFVISKYICNGTSGAIDGALFETLFTLLAVIMVWVFWSSITEDDWPEMVESNAGDSATY